MHDPRQPLLITGGAGFIGSTLVRLALDHGFHVVTLDKLTYAGHRASLAEVLDHPGHTLVVGDITDPRAVSAVLAEYRPQAIVHLAAESHVDRSIANPPQFATTNVVGTCVLLDATTRYWQQLRMEVQQAFRFLNVSTDEVFGSAKLGEHFTEQSPIEPNSPYAASKAAAEHLGRAFAHTYQLPVITANPGNNYGPRQHPEKFIPKMILAAIRRQPLEIYGDGQQMRDWIHVEDCSSALLAVLAKGVPGSRYLVGADYCVANLHVAEMICDIVDELMADGGNRRQWINHGADRPGHDRRYALNTDHVRSVTSWRPTHDFPTGLRQTVRWYTENDAWIATVSK